MTDHTPIPWRAKASGNDGIWYLDRDPDDCGMIATLWGVDDRAEGNAALIVKAVNEHADAEKALLDLCSRHGFATGHGDTLADIIREIDGQIGKSGTAQGQELTHSAELRPALIDLVAAEADRYSNFSDAAIYSGKQVASILRVMLDRASLAPQPALEPVTCACGFSKEICAPNPCYRKKVHLAGRTPGTKWPDGAPAAPALSPATVEALRSKLPKYVSALAREIASEAEHDMNDEHYASHASYALARWFDALLASPGPSGEPVPSTDEASK